MQKLVIAVCFCCLSELVLAQPPDLREGDKLDGVVAVVGKYPIFRSSIDGQFELLAMQQGRKNLTREEAAKYKNGILQTEIDQKVLVVRAEQDSITVNEDEIDERLDEQIKMFERQAGTRENLEKQLGKTVAEVKSSADYRDRAKESILIEKLRSQKFSPNISVSRHDVEDFYAAYKDSLPQIGEQVELATIIKYVKPQPGQKEKTKIFAVKIIDSLRKGADFAEFAARYSQHATAKSGGDLGGPYPRGTFVPEFEAAAFKLKPGEVSDVVETDQGLHIIKLIERRGEEIKVAQILLKPSASRAEDDSMRRIVDSLHDAIEKGADFRKAASEYSDDPESKNNSGDIGRVRLAELSEEQRKVVGMMKPGEISQPMKIGLAKNLYGYQIIKLISKVPAHTPTVETDYKDLETTAKQWKQLKDFQKFVSESRKQVYVDVKDSFLN